jgi:hypothetical protein
MKIIDKLIFPITLLVFSYAMLSLLGEVTEMAMRLYSNLYTMN